MAKVNKKKTSKKKKKAKKKSRNYAKNEKFPGLNPLRQVGNRKEYHDFDYVNKLSPEEKEWLHSFVSETLITNFDHAGKKIYKTKEERKKFYSENNARNRCMLSMAKTKGLLNHYEATQVLAELEKEEIPNPGDMEDAILRAIAIKDSGNFDDEDNF
jgi:hypothetical protein